MFPKDVKYKAIVHYKHFLPSLRTVARIYNVSKSMMSRWVNEVRIRRYTQRINVRVYDAIRAFVKCRTRARNYDV